MRPWIRNMCFQVWGPDQTSTSMILNNSNVVCFGSKGSRPRIWQCLPVVGPLPEKISMWPLRLPRDQAAALCLRPPAPLPQNVAPLSAVFSSNWPMGRSGGGGWKGGEKGKAG